MNNISYACNIGIQLIIVRVSFATNAGYLVLLVCYWYPTTTRLFAIIIKDGWTPQRRVYHVSVDGQEKNDNCKPREQGLVAATAVVERII